MVSPHRPLARAGPAGAAAPRAAARAPAPRGPTPARAVAAAATPPAELRFAKYQGLGNDFVLLDCRAAAAPPLTPAQAARVCDRHFGVGADGVIFALPPPPGGGADLTMRIYNSDGSEPEMCGNGIRCLARFVADADGAGAATALRIATGAGLIRPTLLPDGRVRVDMGPPTLAAADVPTTLAPTRDGAAVAAELAAGGRRLTATAVSMGNPHAVLFADALTGLPLDLDALDFPALGPAVESHPAFPARVNAHFVEVLSRAHARVLVWERGAGPTLACGTGACAVLVAGVLERRLDRAARVDLPGGPLEIEWREADGRVYMTGPAERVFAGALSVEDLGEA
jgi:diaminopimelate epimerase